jgi:hypothetical protein
VKPKTVRCAIYTRKSTEHNLDLEFNSLHAQREAWARSLWATGLPQLSGKNTGKNGGFGPKSVRIERKTQYLRPQNSFWTIPNNRERIFE